MSEPAVRVLVVDDSAMTRRLVRSALSAEGWDVDEADSGAGALARARASRYDAVVVDFLLPDHDGIVLAEALAREGSGAAVVALSASDSTEVAARFLRAGAVEYLHKDRLTPLRIVHSVKQALRVREAQATLRLLPALRARPPPDDLQDEIRAAADAARPSPAPGRALVVDDTSSARDLLRRVLERAGWTVDVASTGSDALRVADARAPDVVVVDYLLPDMDGVRLLEELRGHGVHAPVVALTAHGDEAVAERFIRAGAIDFLAKDDLPEFRLLHTLRNAMLLRMSPPS